MNLQSSGKGSNLSSEQVVNPVFASKDDSLDKKHIQIIVVIVVKVVKLIFDSAPQLLRSYEEYESVARIVRHLFSNSTYIKL